MTRREVGESNTMDTIACHHCSPPAFFFSLSSVAVLFTIVSFPCLCASRVYFRTISKTTYSRGRPLNTIGRVDWHMREGNNGTLCKGKRSNIRGGRPTIQESGEILRREAKVWAYSD